MRKLFLTVFLVLLAAWACADFPGSPIGGGGGSTTTDASLLVSGTLPAARLADNTYNGSVLIDNTIGAGKIKITSTLGYSLFGNGSNNSRVGWGHYLSSDDNNVASIRLFDAGNIYINSYGANGGNKSYLNLLSTGETNLVSSVGDVAVSATVGSVTLSGNNVTIATGVPFIADNVAITGGSISGVTGLGTGTVTGPATATEDNVVCWGADNVTIKDCGAPLSSYALSGHNHSATYQPLENQRTSTTDNVTFGVITFDTATSTCVPADNNCGQTANNTGDPTGANLSAGLQWLNTTSNLFKVRNGDNTATLTMLDKSVKFTKEWGCDNVVLALDNNSIVFPAGFAQAVTIDNIMARVSTDNVGFQLKHCAPDNVSSCTYINNGLVATNGAGMTSTATFTDATIPAGRPVLIEFTTVGTSNSNRFYMGVRYSVD